MVVRYGTVVPNGFLPVYSVDTVEEAKSLIVMACPLGLCGDYIAPELAREQTVENLFAFGKRLTALHKAMKRRRPS